MASILKLYTNYAFSNDFSQFPNPQTVPQENYTVAGGAIIPGATWGEEISFPMFGGIDVFQHDSNLTSAVPAALFPELIGVSLLQASVALMEPSKNLVTDTNCKMSMSLEKNAPALFIRISRQLIQLWDKTG
ncbi:hypothetical protein GQ457_02G033600 [Hibiscus cannabinus]